MAEITNAGIQPRSLAQIRSDLLTAFRRALGGELRDAEESPQGQLTGVLAQAFADAEALATWAAAGLSPYTAQGDQLDRLCALMGVERIPGLRSVVEVTFSGTAGTSIPAGTQVGSASSLWRTTEHVVIGSLGSVNARCENLEFGPIVAEADTITRRVDAITGLRSITNALPAEPGRNPEPDSTYLRRYLEEVTQRGGGYLDSIRSALLAVTGVTNALVRDNSTGASVTTQHVAIPAASVLAIVRGGTDEDVGAALLRKKPAGVPTAGEEDVDVEYGNLEVSSNVRFTRAEPLPLAVSAVVTFTREFETGGLELMQRRAADWAAGTWSSGEGFDTTGLSIGEDLDLNRLRTPMLSVRGQHLDDLKVELRDGVGYFAVRGSNAFTRWNLASDRASLVANASGGSVSSTNLVRGIAFHNGTLYALIRASGNSTLATIDPKTGVVTEVGDCGRAYYYPLASDGTNLYAYGTDNILYRFAPDAPGSATAVGAATVGMRGGLYFDSGATGYGVSGTQAYSIVKATGVQTALSGTLGTGIAFPRALYPRLDGDIGLIAQDGTDAAAFFTLDTDTGAATRVGTAHIGLTIYGFAETKALPSVRLSDIFTLAASDVSLTIAQ